MCACERIVRLITRFVGNYRYDPNERTTTKVVGGGVGKRRGRRQSHLTFCCCQRISMSPLCMNVNDYGRLTWHSGNSERDLDKGGPKWQLTAFGILALCPPLANPPAPCPLRRRRKRRPLTITASICRHLGSPFPRGKASRGGNPGKIWELGNWELGKCAWPTS